MLEDYSNWDNSIADKRNEVKAMKYKSVIVTVRGGPEVLKIIQNDLRPPEAGEARIKILAAPVCAPDITARYGLSPFVPKPPFTPGYAVIGIVDAVGEGVTNVTLGDRVAVRSQRAVHP